MNETITTLLERRSIRHYESTKVAQEDLDLILQTGLYAASGGNHQVARFLAIENPQVLRELTVIVREEFRMKELIEGRYWNKTILHAKNNPETYDYSFQAPVVVIVYAPDGWPNGMADCANALQNMQVAATALNLGACWVNQLHWLTDNKRLREYLEPFGLALDQKIYGSMVLGHPAGPKPRPAPRKENRVAFVR